MNFTKVYQEMLVTPTERAEREAKKQSLRPAQEDVDLQESILQWRNMQHTQKLIQGLEAEGEMLLTQAFNANNTGEDTRVILARLYECATILTKVKGN